MDNQPLIGPTYFGNADSNYLLISNASLQANALLSGISLLLIQKAQLLY